MTAQDRTRWYGGVDHTGVTVTDLDAAVDFFVTWFGAEVLFRLARVDDPTGRAPARLGAPRDASFALAMLALGPARLELLQWWTPQDPVPPAGPHAAGAAHLAIRVSDVAEALQRLRVVPGVEVIGEPVTFDSGPTPGLTNAFVRTGFGLLLELVDWGDGGQGSVGGVRET